VSTRTFDSSDEPGDESQPLTSTRSHAATNTRSKMAHLRCLVSVDCHADATTMTDHRSTEVTSGADRSYRDDASEVRLSAGRAPASFRSECPGPSYATSLDATPGV
jgi:hypothetical protein